MIEKKNVKKLAWVAVALVIMVLSMTVVSKAASNPENHKKTIEALDEKKADILKLTATSAAASTAIAAIPGDGYNTIDGSWLLCNGKNQTEIKKKYKKVWKQIAERFKNYDEHLLFESMNEEFDGSYSEPNKEYYQNINDYNQIFVDTVRKTGDNNTKRWLIIPGWNTNIDYTAGDYGFKLPTDQYRDKPIDKEEQRIMISVHYYSPWDFCGGENGVITQ